MSRPNFFSPIVGLFGDIQRARAAVTEYDRLSRMSDAALSARGITRGDLPGLAFKAGFESK